MSLDLHLAIECWLLMYCDIDCDAINAVLYPLAHGGGLHASLQRPHRQAVLGGARPGHGSGRPWGTDQGPHEEYCPRVAGQNSGSLGQDSHRSPLYPRQER